MQSKNSSGLSSSITVIICRGRFWFRNCKPAVFPLAYDKNGACIRDHRFTKGYNEWQEYIRATNEANSGIGESLLSEAKLILEIVK